MLRAILLIVRKDLTVEVRSRELAYTTLFFAVSCVLVFAFSLVPMHNFLLPPGCQ